MLRESLATVSKAHAEHFAAQQFGKCRRSLTTNPSTACHLFSIESRSIGSHTLRRGRSLHLSSLASMACRVLERQLWYAIPKTSSTLPQAKLQTTDLLSCGSFSKGNISVFLFSITELLRQGRSQRCPKHYPRPHTICPLSCSPSTTFTSLTMSKRLSQNLSPETHLCNTGVSHQRTM